MSIVFQVAEYTAVRAAINVELTAVQLPDTVIALPLYAGEAIRYVTRSLSAEQMTAEPDSAKTAAVYLTASLVLPAISQVQKEVIAGGEITWKIGDVDKRSAALKAQALDILNEIREANPNPNRPSNELKFFSLAKNDDGHYPMEPDSFNGGF